jgi:hypothetical protein
LPKQKQSPKGGRPQDGRLDDEHLVHRLRKPLPDGWTERILTPLQLVDLWRT